MRSLSLFPDRTPNHYHHHVLVPVSPVCIIGCRARSKSSGHTYLQRNRPVMHAHNSDSWFTVTIIILPGFFYFYFFGLLATGRLESNEWLSRGARHHITSHNSIRLCTGLYLNQLMWANPHLPRCADNTATMAANIVRWQNMFYIWRPMNYTANENIIILLPTSLVGGQWNHSAKKSNSTNIILLNLRILNISYGYLK